MSVNNTHHNLLKILFATTLCLVMVAALGAAVMFSRTPQSVDSQASVKKGIVVVNLAEATRTPVMNQPMTVVLVMDTKQAVINNAAFGIRFKGSQVKNVKFTPSSTETFKTNQTLVQSPGSDAGINISLVSTNGKSKAYPTGTVVGTLSFVPTAAGPLNIYFDSNTSHVYQFSTLPSPRPTAVPSPYVTARPVPTYAPGTELPHTQNRETIIIGDPQPSVRPTAMPSPQLGIDILQTPESLTVFINSGIPTSSVAPSPSPMLTPMPSPIISCDPAGNCPPGYYCVQPTMPPCPVGKMCPQVMPARRCETSRPTPMPTSMPTRLPSPRPTAYPTAMPGYYR